jgi:hypothetical protein
MLTKSRQAKIVMMSDLIKVQNTPQFNWYTCWTSLGANGMPDNLIKEGLKQPDCIKIFFGNKLRRLQVMLRPTRLDLALNTYRR